MAIAAAPAAGEDCAEATAAPVAARAARAARVEGVAAARAAAWPVVQDAQVRAEAWAVEDDWADSVVAAAHWAAVGWADGPVRTLLWRRFPSTLHTHCQGRADSTCHVAQGTP